MKDFFFLEMVLQILVSWFAGLQMVIINNIRITHCLVKNIKVLEPIIAFGEDNWFLSFKSLFYRKC